MLKNTFRVQYIDYEKDQYFEIPEECPHCGKIMSPKFYDAVSDYRYDDRSNNVTVSMLLKCVSCDLFFTRMFFPNQLIDRKIPSELKLSYTPPVEANIPEEIESMSPNFSAIYTQALTAKQSGLDQIYGMGLRKALEFLVKDFAIYLNPTESENIKKQSLGSVIKTYFTEFADITALFTAAAWIGNDETHYERKHPDKDAETIRKFISVTMSQISSRLVLDEAFKMIEETSQS